MGSLNTLKLNLFHNPEVTLNEALQLNGLATRLAASNDQVGNQLKVDSNQRALLPKITSLLVEKNLKDFHASTPEKTEFWFELHHERFIHIEYYVLHDATSK